MRGFLALFWSSLLLIGCAKSGSSQARNPPLGGNGEITGETNFAILVRTLSQGQTSPTPWSGYWWPYAGGGTSDALALYESAFGTSGAASWEQSHHGASVPGAEPWFGHCNGWAAAAVLFPEPHAAITRNGVRFGISDQKALLSEVAMEVNADFFGQRNDDNDTSSLSFRDVFPNQFYLVLTNIVGRGQGLVMDRYTGDQVWNHAIAGYKNSEPTPDDYLGASPSAPNVYRIQMTTQIWWLRDDVDPDHQTEPFGFSDGPSYDSRVLRYELWLDGPVQFDAAGRVSSSGNVVLARQGSTVLGGDWLDSGMDILNSHPDYLWVVHSVAASSGFANPNVNPGLVSALLRR